MADTITVEPTSSAKLDFGSSLNLGQTNSSHRRLIKTHNSRTVINDQNDGQILGHKSDELTPLQKQMSDEVKKNNSYQILDE